MRRRCRAAGPTPGTSQLTIPKGPAFPADHGTVGLHSTETTEGPVAVDGRTINLVARTTTLTLGGATARPLGTWSRPVYVEILDGEGRRQVVKLRDRQALVATVVAGIATVLVLGAGLSQRKR